MSAVVSTWVRVCSLALFLALGLSDGSAVAQPYDVPYVPTPQVVVDEMLRVASVVPEDYVIDLGCGDGRIPVTAAAYFGARALGVEIDPGRIAESHANAKAAGVTGRVEFVNRNLFDVDISQATVVTMYLLPDINLKLRPRLLASLKPGTRIVSHDFSMGDWKPDRIVRIQKNIYFWVVPAQIAGKWKLETELPGVGSRSYELEVRQKFQEIDLYARGETRNYAVWEPSLIGEVVNFVIVDGDLAHRYEGRVRGKTIDGVVRTGAGSAEVESQFRATWTGVL
jgi:SAM-dependent methyltransferase